MPKENKELKTLFEGVDGLSENFITEAEQIFNQRVEAAVAQKLTESEQEHVAEIKQLTEAHTKALAEKDTQIEEAVKEASSNLVESVDTFLDQQINEWAAENAVGIDATIKTEMAESLLLGMATLFKENNIQVPEGSQTIVEALQTENDELRSEVNTLMTENQAFKKNENDQLMESVVSEVCEGLADTQVDSIRELVEGVTFKGEANYRMRVEAAKHVVCEGPGKYKEGEGKDGEMDGTKKDKMNEEGSEVDDDRKDKKNDPHKPKQMAEAVVVDENGKPLNESDTVDDSVAAVLALLS